MLADMAAADPPGGARARSSSLSLVLGKCSWLWARGILGSRLVQGRRPWLGAHLEVSTQQNPEGKEVQRGPGRFRAPESVCSGVKGVSWSENQGGSGTYHLGLCGGTVR